MNTARQFRLAGWLGAIIVGSVPSLAGSRASEESLITDLKSPKQSVVVDALSNLEGSYLTSTNAHAAMKELLRDPRLEVRRKAARVLGMMHAPVSETDVAAICEMLKSQDPWEIMEGLKALKGLNAPTAVPQIASLLTHPKEHVIREACRALATNGRAEEIPALEALANHADGGVRTDASKAIAAIRARKH